ncbi:MAG: polyprenyl synthetase family protein, partial [Rikenellaceae bacterium]|nr:polyprenyl synthetase family protein [Rikenellaceae bacterium]
MIRLKTAVLLAGAVQLGAICGGASDEDAQLMYEFGENLGLLFQITDDILDTYGNPEIFGKSIGGDIRCGKKTFL